VADEEHVGQPALSGGVCLDRTSCCYCCTCNACAFRFDPLKDHWIQHELEVPAAQQGESAQLFSNSVELNQQLALSICTKLKLFSECNALCCGVSQAPT